MTLIKKDPVSWTRSQTLVTSIVTGAPSHFRNTISRDNVRTTGDNIKGWKKRISEGLDATTTLVGTRFAFHDFPFEYYIKSAAGTWLVTGKLATQMQMPSDVNATLETTAAAQCKQAFAKKVRSKTRSWQGGVFAGELRETAKLLASPTKRLRKEVVNLLEFALKEKRKIRRIRELTDGRSVRERRDALRQLASIRNTLADTWLEWSFGVKPMIQDANDASTAFRRLVKEDGLDILTVKSTVELEEFNFPVPRQQSYLVHPGVTTYLVADIGQFDRCTYTIRGGIRAKSPVQGMPLPMIFGLDLSNVAPTAWELIPWSFFVDYFTDVGSAIDAWSIRLVDFSWCNSTIRNSRRLKMINPRISGGPSSGFATFYCPGPYVSSGSIYKVNRTSGLPPMEPYRPQFRIPGYPSTKWLNIASLVNGILALKR